MRHAYYVALAIACAILPAAAAPIDDAKRDIIQTYDFDPSVMSFDQQAERAPALSELWGRFDKAPESYHEALRALLTQDGGREMLYCDGGMLFLDKAVQPSDRGLGLKSIERCSLSEIQQTPYFYTMHSQALAGVDTLVLQFKMLTRPGYQVFIPMHALTLGQDYAFVYPLLVQDESAYTKRLIERTKTEKDPTAVKTLLLGLYYSATPNAEAAIHSMASATTLSAEVQESARLFESRIDEARKTDPVKVHEWIKQNEMAIAPNATEAELREGRRKRMRAISDEALMDCDIYTLLIYQARKK